MQCTVCAEPFNKSFRKKVVCPQCNVDVCRSCVTTYMLQNQDSQEHCMNCKMPWTRRFFSEQMTKVFMNREYKRSREASVFDTEKARLAATLPYVESRKRTKVLAETLTSHWKEYDALQEKIRRTNEEIDRERRFFYRNESEVNEDEENARKIASRGHCIKDDCRGLIDHTWKCATCDTPVCNRCMRERVEGHICNAEDVQAMQVIRNDTKPCPSCGVRIYLIEGCNQMWCTHCNTAFNWRTLQLIRRGFYHNPHYAEYQIANGGTGEGTENYRPQGGPNGGCVNYHDVTSRLREIFGDTDEGKKKATVMRGFLMRANYFLDYESDPREWDKEKQLREYRVAYLMNTMKEEDFKVQIQRVDKAYSKRCETSAIYSMYGNSVRDVLGRFAISKDIDFPECMKSIESLVEYTRNCLSEINFHYSGKRGARFHPNYFDY